MEFEKTSSAHGVCLKFSSEENGEMLVVWTYDKERSGDVFQTGLGIEGMNLYLISVCVLFPICFHKILNFQCVAAYETLT